MKTLYLDCGMGAAGDMLTSALLEIIPDSDSFLRELNEIGIPNVKFVKENAVKCGITGTHMSVYVDGIEEDEEMHSHDDRDHEHSHDHHHEHSHDNHDHDHHHEHSHDDHDHDHHHEHSHDHTHGAHSHSHSSMADIEHIVRDHLKINARVAEKVLEVYRIIAEAESSVHGVPVTDIHFHEVGTMDAVADITAVCMLLDKISPDKIVASPIHVGSGQVKCAHGILPVPAPATAHILSGVPIYGGSVKGELCTPTGAAILKCFVDEFGDMPVMRTDKIGYGMGKKDFERANCVRAILGNTSDDTDEIIELACNLDDVTAESIGFAMDMLLQNGAKDVFTINIGMKKSRPGIMLSVLCNARDRELMRELIFRHTTTLGIREYGYKRYTLSREIVSEDTIYGKIRKKISTGYGVTREKYEYDDLANIANENGISIDDVLKELRKNKNE